MKKLIMAFVVAVSLTMIGIAMAANVTVTIQQIDADGLNISMTEPDTTDTLKVRNDGRILLHFRKTSSGTATITVTTPGTVQGLAIADLTFTVPESGGSVMAGPFPKSLYNDSSDDMSFTVSDTLQLTYGAFRL